MSKKINFDDIDFSDYQEEIEELKRLTEELLNDKEIQNISFELARIECIVASNRVDGIISETFGISRSIAKEKIVSGDLYVNDKNIITPSYNLVENDIVSIRKLGKI